MVDAERKQYFIKGKTNLSPRFPINLLKTFMELDSDVKTTSHT